MQNFIMKFSNPAAFNIAYRSRCQVISHSAVMTGHIDVPLTQIFGQTIELESSGGAR